MSGKKNYRLRRLFLALALLCPTIGLGAQNAEQSEAEVDVYLAAAHFEAEQENANFPVRAYAPTPTEIAENQAISEDLAREEATKDALVEFVKTHDDSLLSLKELPTSTDKTPQINRGESRYIHSKKGPDATSAPTGNSKTKPLKGGERRTCTARPFGITPDTIQCEFFAGNTGYHSIRQGYI